jgi:hypothetical protein
LIAPFAAADWHGSMLSETLASSLRFVEWSQPIIWRMVMARKYARSASEDVEREMHKFKLAS